MNIFYSEMQIKFRWLQHPHQLYLIYLERMLKNDLWKILGISGVYFILKQSEKIYCNNDDIE